MTSETKADAETRRTAPDDTRLLNCIPSDPSPAVLVNEELVRALEPFAEIAATKGGTPESDGLKELLVVMMEHVGPNNGMDIVGKFATACLNAKAILSRSKPSP